MPQNCFFGDIKQKQTKEYIQQKGENTQFPQKISSQFLRRSALENHSQIASSISLSSLSSSWPPPLPSPVMSSSPVQIALYVLSPQKINSVLLSQSSHQYFSYSIWLTLCSVSCIVIDCGDSMWQNAELFTLTYGAIVRQLITDLEEVEEVNKQLDQM